MPLRSPELLAQKAALQLQGNLPRRAPHGHDSERPEFLAVDFAGFDKSAHDSASSSSCGSCSRSDKCERMFEALRVFSVLLLLVQTFCFFVNWLLEPFHNLKTCFPQLGSCRLSDTSVRLVRRVFASTGSPVVFVVVGFSSSH